MQTTADFAGRWRNDETGADGGPRGSRNRAVYLQTTPDATFAMVHVPASPTEGSTGVVICPLFGWDDLCTHRSRRTWAQSLAAAGYPTVRFDLPGTGDSAGSPHTPGQLESWTASVTAAAAWLKDELGCSRVCALGIGFGGMLAWLAVSEGAPIDDLALWAVPTRGRRLLREIHAGAMLSINSRVHLPGSPDGELVEAAGPGDGALLDEAGQLTTKETADSLRGIDLLKTPLPEAQARRVLLFKRSEATIDDDWAAHLHGTGADLTVTDGNSYAGLMRYVQQSEVPHDAIESSIRWLADGVGAASSPTPAESPCSPATASDSIEFVHDGAIIRETPITVVLPSGTVCGVLTEPVGVDALNLTVAFFSGGSDRRIGPNRMWVEHARRWAALGLTAVRVDPNGVGDSDGDERRWDHVRDHYRASHVDHTLELLHELSAQGLPGRFVLVGFCSGGFRSIFAAMRDHRVVGVFALGLPFFRWTWWASNVRDSWLASWEPKSGDSKLKVAVARTLQRALKLVQAGQHRLISAVEDAGFEAELPEAVVTEAINTRKSALKDAATTARLGYRAATSSSAGRYAAG